MTYEPILNKKGQPVFLYDRHMPKTDDIELIVLKGHLLIERLLNDLADAVLPNPKFLPDKLSFYQLAHVVRAAVPQRSDDPCWELILKLNTLRNDLAHKLESPKRAGTLRELFKIHDQVQPAPEMIVDKTAEQMLGESDRLRLVIEDSMKFLAWLTFRAIEQRGQ